MVSEIEDFACRASKTIPDAVVLARKGQPAEAKLALNLTIRDADVMGDGIYKSTDAGATWTNLGLRETGRIGRIIVHPTNPDIVFACALGRATGPQQERGVYRTTDGGRTWARVLFVDPNTGCSGLTMDAHDPDVLLAGTWDVVMHTWAMFSGGTGRGI